MIELIRAKRFFKDKRFPGYLQALAGLLFAIILCFLMIGPQDFTKNLSSILLWFFWWPLFIIQYLLVGRFWCAVCPFGTLGDMVRKTLGINLPVPQIIKKYALLIIGFFLALIIWAEEIFHVQSGPMATASLLLVVTTAVVGVNAIYERRAWCRYMCPLGGMGVVYARAGMLQLRGNPEKCRTCATVRCHVGSELAEGCPMDEFPRIKESNAYCIFCGNCVKNCLKDSTKVEIRMPSTEFWLLRKPRLSEDLLAVLLAAVISSVNFTHGFPAVIGLLTDLAGYNTGFTLFYLGWLAAFFLLMALAGHTAAALNGMSVKMNFTLFAYAIIPLSLATHIGHSITLLLRGGHYLQQYLDDHIQAGWSLGAYTRVGVQVAEVLQFVLLLAGLAFSLLAAYNIATTFFARQKKIWASAVPFMLLYTFLACLNGWILVNWNTSVGQSEPHASRTAELVAAGFAGTIGAILIVALILKYFLSPVKKERLTSRQAKPNMRLTVRAEITEIATTQDALELFAQPHGIGVKPIFDVNMALEELMTYAIIHHQPSAPGTAVQAEFSLNFAVMWPFLNISLEQHGPPHNPFQPVKPEPARGRQEKYHPDIEIQRLRNYASLLRYERKEGVNVLTAIMRIDTEKEPGVPKSNSTTTA
jgi:anti-sigma regulatory factor (Ser/Thr protein kinase)/ferredoxin